MLHSCKERSQFHLQRKKIVQWPHLAIYWHSKLHSKCTKKVVGTQTHCFSLEKNKHNTSSVQIQDLFSLHHLKINFKALHSIYLHKKSNLYALSKIHECTYNCFKSDIPGNALEKTDLWFHLVAQLMLLRGHRDWVLQYEEVWLQPWKKSNFQCFMYLQNCIFNTEFHTTPALQETLTMSPGNNQQLIYSHFNS